MRYGLSLGASDTISGPAGGILQSWRQLVHRSTGIDARILDDVAAAFGLNLPDALADILREAESAISEDRLPLRSAARVLAHVRRHHRRAEFLGLWLADAVLAHRLSWPIPLPLLVSGLAQRSGGRRGPGPGTYSADWRSPAWSAGMSPSKP